MFASALSLDMEFYSTSMAYGLALPIVAIPIIAPFTVRVWSSTVLRYK
jgi:hypothetical protein